MGSHREGPWSLSSQAPSGEKRASSPVICTGGIWMLSKCYPGGRGGVAPGPERGRPNSALCPQCVPVPTGWPAQLGVSAATPNAWGAAAGRKTPGPAWPAATSTSRAPATGPALRAPTSMRPGAASRQSTAAACALCLAAPPPSASTRAAAWPSAPQASPAMAAGECRGVRVLLDQ